MPTEVERHRNTLWARRKREAAQGAALHGRRTCPLRRGKYGLCGGLLEHEVLRDGTIRTRCPRCERRRQGICQDCPRPVEGRVGSARRCRDCKKREKKAAYTRYRARHPEVVARWKRAAQLLKHTDPARYAHRLATKKAWRERNVVRIKLGKRKWRLNPDRPNGYSSREKYLAYHADYRAKHREEKRLYALRRYYELHPDRPHPICACGCEQRIPWDGSGRPRKWLPEHDPWPRCLTPEEVLMKGIEAAIATLERTAERVRKKLQGVEQLQAEVAAIERATAELRAVNGAGGAVVAPRRGRRPRLPKAS